MKCNFCIWCSKSHHENIFFYIFCPIFFCPSWKLQLIYATTYKHIEYILNFVRWLTYTWVYSPWGESFVSDHNIVRGIFFTFWHHRFKTPFRTMWTKHGVKLAGIFVLKHHNFSIIYFVCYQKIWKIQLWIFGKDSFHKFPLLLFIVPTKLEINKHNYFWFGHWSVCVIAFCFYSWVLCV